MLGAAASIAALARNELNAPGAGSASTADDNPAKTGLTITENEALGAIRWAKLQRPNLGEIPDSVGMATIEVESNFDPASKGTIGEIGLMQIRPTTWADAIARAKLSPDLDPWKVSDNILVGLSYLRLIRQELISAGIISGSGPNDWVMVDQGYNLGAGGVKSGKSVESRKAKFILARMKFQRAGLA